MKTIAALFPFLLHGLTAAAAIVEPHTFNSLNLNIPDGNPTGLANVQNFSTAITMITDVDVSFHIVGTPDGDPTAFNGDLYAYLTHGSGFSVLLNRVGRATGNLFGYADNGFNITFDDAAANGDVHVYRNVTTPAAGQPLTGIWQPDARTTDPNLVLASDARSPGSFLSSLNGLSAAGDWTLFVADLSTGEQQTLADWSLTLTGVPEPATGALVVGGVLTLVRARRRHLHRQSDAGGAAAK